MRAVFRPDLDEALSYVQGLWLLTTRTLRVQRARGEWQTLELGASLRVERREHAGVTALSVLDGERLCARCHYTLAVAKQASDFVAELEAACQGAARAETDALDADDFALPEVVPRGRPLWRLLTFTKQRIGAVALGLLLTLGTTAVGLIPPYLTMPLVDQVLVPWQTAHGVVPGSVYHALFVYLGALALAALLAWLLAWAQGAVLAWVSELISADLRNRAFSHLQRLSLQYFGGKRTGDLIARISSETDRLCSFLSDTLIDFVTDVLMIVGTSSVLFVLDPLLAVAALVSFPFIAWFMVRVRSALTHGFLRGGRVWAQMTNILADTIPGIRVVKAFSQEKREVARFEKANQRIVDVNNRVNTLWTSFWPLVALLNQLGLLVVWAVGAWQVLHQRITVGVLTAFIAYISRFYTRVESMSRMLTVTQRASAAAQRLFEILDRVPSVLEPKDPLKLGEVRGELRFDHVSFRYGSRLVLDDVSFSAAPGQMVGIVGHTGSGKSTIANLICRFYDASQGAVRLDGVDLRQVALDDYRRHIGIVLQDAFLFFGTIGENVAYGMPSAGPAELLAAARAARAHEFVLRLPEAYDSLVGERGQALSGGERQRIAIARAILVDPKLLILDEATSAVDVQTEREIQAALDNVVAGRTTIAIAHRLTTLRKADVLVVLKAGKVVEIGSPSELLAKDGEYARLYRAQSAGHASERAAATSQEAASDADDANETKETSAPASGTQRAEPLLVAAELRLACDDDGRLFALADGAPRVELFARRCFPLTNAERFVCLVDARGHERACIESLSELDADTRSALERALAHSDFLPVVRRIERVTQQATSSTWLVLTDRGPTEFVVDQEDHVRALDDGRFVITDSHGMRYLVPAPSELDAHSRHRLARFA